MKKFHRWLPVFTLLGILSTLLWFSNCTKKADNAPEGTGTEGSPSSNAVSPLGLGNPNAPKGGNFVVGFSAYPKALLYYLGFDEFSLMVNDLTFEALLDAHPETYDPLPLLAESWTVSKDKKTFTFKLNKNARFSDGTPVTAEDVKFTWDVIRNPKHKTAPMRAALASFESCKVMDKHTVVFRAKTLHFQNLEKAGGLYVLPKHFYSKGNFNKAFNKKLLGSGPYTLQRVERGKRITLKRNPNHWAAKLPQNIGKYNFDRIALKTVGDYNVQFEIFKRGDIDYFYFLISKMWVTQTTGPLFKKGLIKKIRAVNSSPASLQGVAWNLRRPLFQDRRVRLALSHLMNRDRWIKDLFYDQYLKATGLVGIRSEYHSKKLQPVPYDPKKARQLLKEAGWTKTGSDGVLIKGKQRFEFEMLDNNQSSLRYLTMFQEDLKKMGIKMNIRMMDWASSIKQVDDRKFDAKMVARGRGVHPSDFAVSWGSKQAKIVGSANLTGYGNPKVDELAQKIDTTFEKEKRIPLVKQLDEIVTHDQPMSYAWEPQFYRLAHWDKFSYPGKGYFKYSDWRTTFHYWWYDKEKAARVKKQLGR